MSFVIYFSILFINLLYYNFHKDKTKENVALLLCSIVLIGLFFSGGIENADMNFYSPYYYNVYNRSFKATEIGFYALVYICRVFNLGLFGLRGLTFIISIIFVNATLKKTCKNRHLYLVLYMVFIFFINDIQLRNFISMSLMMYACTFLFKKKKNLWKYCLFVAIATIFHTSAIFYFLFLLFELKERKSLLKIILCLSFFLEIVIYLNGKRIPFINIFLNYILSEGSDRLIQYFSSSTNGSLNVVLLIFANIALSNYAYNIVQRKSTDIDVVEFSRLSYYCSLMQVILFPLLFLNVEFYRYPRNVLGLVYISVCNAFVCIGHRTTGRKLMLLMLFTLNSILWIYIAYYLISDWSYVFEPIFYKNILFT